MGDMIAICIHCRKVLPKQNQIPRVLSSTFLTNSHFDLKSIFKVSADLFHLKYNSGTFLNEEVYEVYIMYV